jgi:hypothetical protein
VSDGSECDPTDPNTDCEIELAFSAGNTWNKLRQGVYGGVKMKRGKITLTDTRQDDTGFPKFERIRR